MINSMDAAVTVAWFTQFPNNEIPIIDAFEQLEQWKTTYQVNRLQIMRSSAERG